LKNPPWRVVADGLAVRVRVTPKARRARAGGLAELADSGRAIRAAVTAAPEGGKANAALLRLLAKSWRLPRTALEVTGGATGRLKTVTIRGDGAALAAMLEAWLAATEDETNGDRA
jgi:uncharacterized protein (TIGR00251 family)